MPADIAIIKQHFLEVLSKPTPEQRRAHINDVCGTDAELRNCLRELLEAHEKVVTPPPVTPGENPGTVDYTPQPALEAGTIVAGKYKIIEAIGGGGMGAVYRAKRISDLKMEVALKVIKRGMDSQQIVSRFNVERQALALMNHENIAKVFDAGMLDDGRPFFVMELVKGLSLTAFCDELKLSIPERLDLFAQVCTGIQHAHHKGIVHRDLKPSNIIVGMYDDQAVPKVIDFGLAKALHQPLTDDSINTTLGTFVGTWLYAAPEQAQLNNLDIDTRADIYSLGVILYELLTGTTPIEKARLEHAALNEVVRIIREEEPPKPSTKVHSSAKLPSIAALRRLDPRSLTNKIRGDLDWIVMKALDKDRNRRYSSASDLAAEVQRYLHDEPVQARSPSLRYRMWKVVRKHRGKVIIAALLAVVTTAGAVVSTLGWISAHREQLRADQQARIAKAVNEFLRDDLLGMVDPAVQVKPGQEFVSKITVKETLDRAASTVSKRFAEDPLTEAAVRHTLGKAYLALGDYTSAYQHMEKSEDLRRRHSGKSDPDRLSSLHELGWILMFQSKFDTARDLLQEAYQLRMQVLGAANQDTCKTRFAQAILLENHGKNAEAKQMLEETLALQKLALTLRHRDTLATQRQLASVLENLKQYAAAETMLLELLRMQREVLGQDHPDTFTTQNNLVHLYNETQQYSEAERVLVPLVALSERTYGLDHPRHLVYLTNLAAVSYALKNFQKAADIYKEILPKLKHRSGIAAYDTLAATANYAAVLLELRRYAEAESLLLDAYAGCRQVLGETHEATLQVLENIVSLYDTLNNKIKAKQYQKMVDERRQKAKDTK